MASKLKIAIIGYGKMGKTIERIAIERGHEISCIIDKEEDWEGFPGQSNIAIEFTEPNSALKNVLRCFNSDVPVVSGTTGWDQTLDKAKEVCLQTGQAFVYAPNFSLGVNIFFEINRVLAKLLSPFDEYNPSISETHHTQKLDAPSGTAIALANGIIEQTDRLNTWKLKEVADDKTEIPIVSHRIDKVTGTHVVSWLGCNDVIEIKHQANDRSIFAKGAVLAAELLVGKKGFFNLKDLLNI